MFIIILMDGIVIQSSPNHISNTFEKSANGIYMEEDFDEIGIYNMAYSEYAFNY